MPKAALLDVMIVEDQRAMRTLVHTTLGQVGCTRCIEAEDGEEALRPLDTRRVHLVIADLNMPRLDGLGLLKAVREHPRLRDLAFIMLTSRGDDELVRRAIGLGVNNYVMKPFSIADLRGRIEAVVGVLT